MHVRWLREVFDTLFSTLKLFSRWWFQIFSLFSPLLGVDVPIWRAYFLNGLVQPPPIFFFFGLQEMKKLLQLTIKKMQLRPEVPLTEGSVKRLGPRGVIKWDPTFGRDQTWCKCMAIFRNIPYNSTLYGLVIIIMTLGKDLTCGKKFRCEQAIHNKVNIYLNIPEKNKKTRLVLW